MMIEQRKAPKAYAIQLSKAWGDQFPVDTRIIAMEVSSKQKDCISKIQNLDVPLDAFEGALLRKSGKIKWRIVYSSRIREPGKVNFTIAHEFGHYLLHRNTNGNALCSAEDLRDFSKGAENNQNIEQEANEFASYLLMPILDYRNQINGHPINISLLAHCGDRYLTSLTASAIKLIEFIDRPVLVIVSKGGVIQWARSSDKALKLGFWFKGGTPVPQGSLTQRCHELGTSSNNLDGIRIAHRVWFERANVLESAILQPHYGTVFTLLECKDYHSKVSNQEKDEESFDAFDHFSSYSR